MNALQTRLEEVQAELAALRERAEAWLRASGLLLEVERLTADNQLLLDSRRQVADRIAANRRLLDDAQRHGEALEVQLREARVRVDGLSRGFARGPTGLAPKPR